MAFLRRFASVFVLASFVASVALPPDQRDDSLSWYEGFTFPNESQSSRPSVGPRARPMTIDNEDDNADSAFSIAYMTIEIVASVVALIGIAAGAWIAWRRRAAAADEAPPPPPPAVLVADAVGRIRRIGELVRLLQRLRMMRPR